MQSVEVWEVLLENWWVHVLSRDPYENNCGVYVIASKHIIVVFPSYLALLIWDPYENNCGVYVIASKHIIVVFPSYLALLMLKYGDRMEKSQVACHQVEEEGFSFREAERVIESKLFLDEYPQWGLGPPHQTVILHEMFLHAAGWGQKEAECMCCQGHQSSIPGPNPEVDQSAMELVGY